MIVMSDLRAFQKFPSISASFDTPLSSHEPAEETGSLHGRFQRVEWLIQVRHGRKEVACFSGTLVADRLNPWHISAVRIQQAKGRDD
jgi:hypothetical protein